MSLSDDDPSLRSKLLSPNKIVRKVCVGLTENTDRYGDCYTNMDVSCSENFTD